METLSMLSSKTVAVAAGLAALCLSSAALAAPPGSPVPEEARTHYAPPPTGPTLHKDVALVANFASGSLHSLAAGWNPIDPVTTIKCPGTKPCTVFISTNAQVASSDSGTLWALCTYIDGSTLANGSCYYQSLATSTGSWISGTELSNLTVSPGSHTIQTDIYASSANLSWDKYEFNYQITTP
jgi:hypothetical protein